MSYTDYAAQARSYSATASAATRRAAAEAERRARLEDIRDSLRAEDVSYGELAELQALAPYIAPGDVELLEAAGVPEHRTEQDQAEFDAEDARQQALEVTELRQDAIYRGEPDPGPSGECGAHILDSRPAMVNEDHETSCSLHPSAVVPLPDIPRLCVGHCGQPMVLTEGWWRCPSRLACPSI
jgi:hypothetical protein